MAMHDALLSRCGMNSGQAMMDASLLGESVWHVTCLWLHVGMLQAAVIIPTNADTN
jgi:hypothetical protein